MELEPNHIFHIYNRGNNSQQIFFLRKNYLFFLRKVRKHLLPYCDIIAWCLMPNHFHFMVYVNRLELEIEEQLHGIGLPVKNRVLNDSISIMLRSYTRAINNQEKRTGSLFQNRTKAINVTKVENISPAWFQSKYGAIINMSKFELEYPRVLFDYIHQNPVNDGYVIKPGDWEFSSYRDYVGRRNGTLINRELATEFGLGLNYSAGEL